ncbi:MAG: SMC-Scp complex subunit ScpB [Verrucomicrobia bacterium]|nr:SMC-Scp complex subunit ScpB [Verrucomicrobiota bacterium]
MELRSIIESLLFASPRGLTPADIREIFRVTAENSDEEWIKKLSTTRERSIETELKELAADYAGLGRTYQLRCVAGKWQFSSLPDFSPWQQVLLGKRQRPPRLTQPALETLAIIAYRQPITRPGIEKIRGVSIDGVLGKLMERGLVEEGGKSDLPGKPVLYGTTETFLEYFGMSSLADLPDAAMLKSISSDPNTPLEAPSENLHKVPNPEELTEWGIENTLDLAPNEPPETSEEEPGPEDDDEEEEYDDEDDDDEYEDDDDEDDDDEIGYASRSSLRSPVGVIEATEAQILDLESLLPDDRVPVGKRVVLYRHSTPDWLQQWIGFFESLLAPPQEKSPIHPENPTSDHPDASRKVPTTPFQLEEPQYISLEETELSDSDQNQTGSSESQNPSLQSQTGSLEVQDVELEVQHVEHIGNTSGVAFVKPEGDGHEEKAFEESDLVSPPEEAVMKRTQEEDLKVAHSLEDSVRVESGSSGGEPTLPIPEVEERNNQVEKSRGVKSWIRRVRRAINSIEDPSDPVQFIGLFSKKLWQTLNTIGRKLTNWMSKSSRR